MQRLLITSIISFLFIFTVNAQNKRIIKDNFETNRFQWDEYYENNSSASIQDGCLLLKCNEDNLMAWTVSELPINVDNNFNLSFNFLTREINDDYWFGIVLNYEDENNFLYFVVQEKKFQLVKRVNGVNSIVRRNAIILKKGKDKVVNIKVNKKGNKLDFLVDDMDVITITKMLDFNTFGCIICGDKTIKLTELTIEQIE
jgi:hypothetical protein